MFTCAGWCVLDCVENDTDTAFEASDRVNAVAQEVMLGWESKFSNMSTRWVNGQCFLMMCHSQNHGGSMHPVLQELVRYISEAAPRSYGVIHTFDDELPEPPVFHVLKIVGPDVVQEVDKLLATVDYMD